MNERIKQLAEQAGFRLHLDGEFYTANHKHLPITEDIEKFAELIVRECTSKCEFVANMATITNTGEMARKTKATADSCATMIKQHFGVEE